MKPNSNILHLHALNHNHEPLNSGRASSQDICSVPHRLNDINLSPVSIQHVSHLPEICTTPDKEERRINNFSSGKEDRKRLRHDDDKTRILPKIHNPKAEDRLKALMNLLDKKNPDISQNSRRSSNSRVKERVSLEEKRKVHLVLPPLTSLTPKPMKQKDIDSMKKLFIQSPSRKPIFRIQEAEASKESTQSIRLVPKFLEPLPSENQVSNSRKASVNIADCKKVSFRRHSHNTNEEKDSPVAPAEDKLKYKKLVFKKYKKEKKNNLAPLPHPNVNFDARIHQVSIDDALERLNQLTNQSDNARRDLLKIQENALAIRLSYERKHRNISRMNCKSETRNP